jgi:alpha-L-fucosidase 2
MQSAIAAGAVAASRPRLAFADEPPAESSLLWYVQAAEQWTEALPIGNGRIGAMIFGGVARERLQLNDDTLYAGGPYDPSSPEALIALPKVASSSPSGVTSRHTTSRMKVDGPVAAHAVVPDGW